MLVQNCSNSHVLPTVVFKIAVEDVFKIAVEDPNPN